MESNRIPGNAPSRPVTDPTRDNDEATRFGSAVTRDATRLRSVMGRAADGAMPNNSIVGAVDAGDAPVRDVTANTRPTTLRPPVAGRSLRALMADPSRGSNSVAGDAATRLRTDGFRASADVPEARSVAGQPANSEPVIAATAQSIPPTFATEHQELHSATLKGAATDAQVTPVAAFPAASHSTLQRSYQPPPTSTYQPTRNRRVARPMLAVMAVVAGTAIGVGLYAGGADLIGGIFSGHREHSAPVDDPAAVTERPAPPAPAVSTSDSLMVAAVGDSVHAIDPLPAPSVHQGDAANAGAHQPAVAQPATPSNPTVSGAHGPADRTAPAATAAAERNNSTAGDERAVRQSEPPARTAAMEEIAADNTPREESRAATPASYMVQVRATTDQAEANLVARRLRARGATNVSVLAVPNKGPNAGTTYRVRYTAKGTEAEARAAGTRAGYRNLWVVKKK